MKAGYYIAQRLNELGVTEVYGLVGGSTSGINDGFFRFPGINFVPFHHEQGAGHAAVGSARTNNKLSVCNVTAGCGVTNALTSLLNAYEESVPVLFISGSSSLFSQAKYINKKKGIELRKYGIQDFDPMGSVEHITKYAVTIENIEDVPYELEKAVHLALSGRPGPVWIDVPGNFQNALIPEEYRRYEPEGGEEEVIDFTAAFDAIFQSQRPLVVAGNGIRLGDCKDEFRSFIDLYKIPFVTTFLSKDLVEYDHPHNVGMLGVKGARAANFAMQNADCLIILGCSMNVTHSGYDPKTFSPHSKKIVVDIDKNELEKGMFPIDIPLNCDVKQFFNSHTLYYKDFDVDWWGKKCIYWKNKWPIYDPEVHSSDEGGLNLYEIVESINRTMKDGDCIVVDAGQPCYVLSSNGKYKKNCRFMVEASQGDMGYSIPACVGVHFADPTLNLIIVIGEGSLHTNMQELAVVKKYNIPVKIFVINNDGYLCIKQTQDKFFEGRKWAVSKSTGVYFADISKIAETFEIDYHRVETNQELTNLIPQVHSSSSPVIIECISQTTLDVLPAQGFKPDGSQGGLHEMLPLLDDLEEEMIVEI